jgi:hypothetical protein
MAPEARIEAMSIRRRGFVFLTGADAHHPLSSGHEDLAVADLAGAPRE